MVYGGGMKRYKVEREGKPWVKPVEKAKRKKK